jgi:3-deoxy-manno-octulosonate cytidylyltransferase (CMP-KDO synthetase)
MTIVIPARMASTRFPKKPMALIAGVSMLERVWRIAKSVPEAEQVLIATDDVGLKAFAEQFGAHVVMTSPKCPTGTDRVAEVARLTGGNGIFFSLQGDAPITPPWVIGEVLKAMIEDPTVQIATPAVRLEGRALEEFAETKKKGSSTGTSVVFDKNQNALYFSKSLIPFRGPVYRHIGLYGYRADALQKMNQLPEGPLEKAEMLEQLRALENGIAIRVVEVDYQGRTHGSVDRPEDVAFIERIIAEEGELI